MTFNGLAAGVQLKGLWLHKVKLLSTRSSCCSALAASLAVFPAAAARSARAEDATGVASSRMSYSRFLEYLDMGRVKKVHLPLQVVVPLQVAVPLPVAVQHQNISVCCDCKLLKGAGAYTTNPK